MASTDILSDHTDISATEAELTFRGQLFARAVASAADRIVGSPPDAKTFSDACVVAYNDPENLDGMVLHVYVNNEAEQPALVLRASRENTGQVFVAPVDYSGGSVVSGTVPLPEPAELLYASIWAEQLVTEAPTAAS